MGKKGGADAHPKRDDGHGGKNGLFAEGGVGELAILVVGEFAEKDPLVRPQQVAGRQNDSSGSPRRPAYAGDKCAKKNQKFTDEAVEHRQAERRERDEEKERGELGHGSGEPAVLGDFKGVPAVVEHADQQEESSGGDAVGEHLEHRALHGNVLEGEDPQHDEAKVADAGISDKFLEIGLNEGDQGSVDDADDGEYGDPRRSVAWGVGEK